ncbi:uncharacterized protein PGRI_070270 [Penicillium griseofulvum]|uniref:Uncharacterized protein n=1 Tax=Penicillium patulum TaxID=5078 RepID=A0A135LNJ2_PENPA|nr:uncharacterized protein PGRI_070270 [Penicillium griseofulvum]KXG50536.1 hypothetical protein PGRI_070270 [Penicillium griseofulvum]
MKLATILSIALAGLTTARPAALEAQKVQTITDDLIWSVSDFVIGCSQGGCVFRYDITGDENEMTPKFSTHCDGIVGQATLCEDNNITTTVSPAGWTADSKAQWEVGVVHTWKTWLSDDSLATWYQHGVKNATVPDRNPVHFVMKPTKEYGIA